MTNVSSPVVYRRYDDGYVVRRMTEEDAEKVVQWYNANMGDIAPAELFTCLRCFPPDQPGFYAGEYEGQLVAACVRLPWAADLYYGSLYYVDTRYRGRGFGTRLRDQVARGHVGGATLAVDACLGSVSENNVSKYGYVTTDLVTGRWSVQAGAVPRLAGSGEVSVTDASQVEMKTVLAYDGKYFIRPHSEVRRRCMTEWLSAKIGISKVALSNNNNEVTGLCCSRATISNTSHILGPVYADDATIARTLLQTLAAELPQTDKLIVHPWLKNTECTAMLTSLGFTEEFTLARMHINTDPQEYKPQIFGLTSIDVCGF